MLLTALLLAQTLTLQPYARVEHAPIDEMSGIVRSRRYPVYWVHNDSGDSARFFAIDDNGKVVIPAWLNRREDAGVAQSRPPFEGIQVPNASNTDWEDIAYDGDNLYLADTGNNGNARRDLGVFVVPEPNPFEIDRSRALTWLPLRYPDQKAFPPKGVKPFDCEAVFWLRGKLHFVTKWRNPVGLPLGGAALYRLDTRFTDRANILRKLDQREDLGGWVTAADVSPDGSTLAVLTHMPVSSVWLFSTRAKGDRILSGSGRQIRFTGGNQCEAITWQDDRTVIVTNEQRQMFRIAVGQ